MRIKVASINWRSRRGTAPRAVSYLYDDTRGMVGEIYHETWDDAIARADELAEVLRRRAAGLAALAEKSA